MEVRRGFRENHSLKDGMGGLLLSKQSQDAAVHFAEQIAKDAAVRAPRSDRAPRPGKPKYADNFKVERAAEPFVTKKYQNGHAHAEVFNDAPHAAALEFGNGKTKARHILRDAGAKYHNPLAEES